jgi:hypothetical protein
MEFDGKFVGPAGLELPFRLIKGLKKIFGWENEPWEGFILDNVLYFDDACRGPSPRSVIISLTPEITNYVSLRQAVIYFNSTVGSNWLLLEKFLHTGIEKLKVN